MTVNRGEISILARLKITIIITRGWNGNKKKINHNVGCVLFEGFTVYLYVFWHLHILAVGGNLLNQLIPLFNYGWLIICKSWNPEKLLSASIFKPFSRLRDIRCWSIVSGRSTPNVSPWCSCTLLQEQNETTTYFPGNIHQIL